MDRQHVTAKSTSGVASLGAPHPARCRRRPPQNAGRPPPRAGRVSHAVHAYHGPSFVAATRCMHRSAESGRSTRGNPRWCAPGSTNATSTKRGLWISRGINRRHQKAFPRTHSRDPRERYVPATYVSATAVSWTPLDPERGVAGWTGRARLGPRGLGLSRKRGTRRRLLRGLDESVSELEMAPWGKSGKTGRKSREVGSRCRKRRNAAASEQAAAEERWDEVRAERAVSQQASEFLPGPSDMRLHLDSYVSG